MSNERKPSALDKVLRLFADVKAGEGVLAILFMVNVFLILCAYYMLKPVREGLINNTVLFGVEGDELSTYLGAGMAFLLIPLVGYYSHLASSMSPFKLLAAPRSLALLRQFNKLGVAMADMRARTQMTIINSTNEKPSILRTKRDLLSRMPLICAHRA